MKLKEDGEKVSNLCNLVLECEAKRLNGCYACHQGNRSRWQPAGTSSHGWQDLRTKPSWGDKTLAQVTIPLGDKSLLKVNCPTVSSTPLHQKCATTTACAPWASLRSPPQRASRNEPCQTPGKNMPFNCRTFSPFVRTVLSLTAIFFVLFLERKVFHFNYKLPFSGKLKIFWSPDRNVVQILDVVPLSFSKIGRLKMFVFPLKGKNTSYIDLHISRTTDLNGRGELPERTDTGSACMRVPTGSFAELRCEWMAENESNLLVSTNFFQKWRRNVHWVFTCNAIFPIPLFCSSINDTRVIGHILLFWMSFFSSLSSGDMSAPWVGLWRESTQDDELEIFCNVANSLVDVHPRSRLGQVVLLELKMFVSQSRSRRYQRRKGGINVHVLKIYIMFGSRVEYAFQWWKTNTKCQNNFWLGFLWGIETCHRRNRFFGSKLLPWKDYLRGCFRSWGWFDAQTRMRCGNIQLYILLHQDVSPFLADWWAKLSTNEKELFSFPFLAPAARCMPVPTFVGITCVRIWFSISWGYNGCLCSCQNKVQRVIGQQERSEVIFCIS